MLSFANTSADTVREGPGVNAAAFDSNGARPTRPLKPTLASLRARAGERAQGHVFTTSVDGFSFHLPGDLQRGTGVKGGSVGATDDVIHAPRMRFPVERGPAYVNSQVWGWGGLRGAGGGECDRRNYSYPWRDNFCESRAWVSGACPGGIGHQGVDIRPATCRNNHHWAVAAEAGRITRIGGWAITLIGESGLKYRYLHVNTKRPAVKRGQRVEAGDRIALISNFYGGTPTSIHLHFEIWTPKPGGGFKTVSPYASLIPAYLRMKAGGDGLAAAAMAQIGGPTDFASFQECADCPALIGVPGGETVIGSGGDDPERAPDETPQRKIALRGFAIGRTEVTNRQWEACVEAGFCAPARRRLTWPDPDQPVTGVSRSDITGVGSERPGYLAWVNARAAEAGIRGDPYRLPTEAEWEHALRAGSTGVYHTGASLTPEQANYDARFAADFPRAIRARPGPVTAGSLPANAWGVHEMAGNVWEWTADCWSPSHDDLPTDGSARGPEDCPAAVIRGGSLFSFEDQLRAANRAPKPAGHAERDLGFRVARGF
ncbi:MAG: SUMF1/EgtB/PvdO family nonheme iron enzyme [Pseudomonadota bacterium]